MRVVVGRVGRAHGIRGDVTVDVRTDEPDVRFAAGQTLFGGERMLTVASSRLHSGKLLVSFTELPDRTAAEQLHGTVLEAEIDPDDLPTGDDEYYDHQLVGLTAISGGDRIGTVVELQHLPHQDLLVIQLSDRRALVPFVTELVPEVDLAAGHVVVVDRPGLLDPDSADVVRDPGQEPGS